MLSPRNLGFIAVVAIALAACGIGTLFPGTLNSPPGLALLLAAEGCVLLYALRHTPADQLPGRVNVAVAVIVGALTGLIVGLLTHDADLWQIVGAWVLVRLLWTYLKAVPAGRSLSAA